MDNELPGGASLHDRRDQQCVDVTPCSRPVFIKNMSELHPKNVSDGHSQHCSAKCLSFGHTCLGNACQGERGLFSGVIITQNLQVVGI